MRRNYRKSAPQLVALFMAALTLFASVALQQPSRAGQSMIPSERRLPWQPGIPGGIPSYPVVANVRNYGAKGDGVTDDAAAFRSAIAAVPSSGGAVLIPAGRYLIKSTLQINKSVVLRGEGASKTQLLVNASGVGIEMTKSSRGAWINLTGGYSKGSTSITVADASAFAPGKLAEIQQANDPSIMYTSSEWNVDWAANAVGQIVKVVGVSGNTLTLAEPLNISFRSSLSPQIRTNALLEYAGIEYLTLQRQDTSEEHFVVMKNVAYTWMRGVHSQLARRTNLYVNTGYRCELRQNYFDDATSWTGGGHGYGVELNLHTTGCLIEDNIFRHLRHSMMVHVGANGNVFGYNYSREAYQNQDPGEWTPPDISIHGHYTARLLLPQRQAGLLRCSGLALPRLRSAGRHHPSQAALSRRELCPGSTHGRDAHAHPYPHGHQRRHAAHGDAHAHGHQRRHAAHGNAHAHAQQRQPDEHSWGSDRTEGAVPQCRQLPCRQSYQAPPAGCQRGERQRGAERAQATLLLHQGGHRRRAVLVRLGPA